MDTEALFALENRWPNNQVIVSKRTSFGMALGMLSTSAEQNFYDNYLTLDEQDSKNISEFAIANGMA